MSCALATEPACGAATRRPQYASRPRAHGGARAQPAQNRFPAGTRDRSQRHDRIVMAARAQAPPRQDVDHPGMAIAVQREGHVDRGEAGADQQHRGIVGETIERRGIPRIGEHPARPKTGKRLRQARQEVSLCEDNRTAAQALATRQQHHFLAGLPDNVLGVSLAHMEQGTGLRHSIEEKRTQVMAIGKSRHKAVAPVGRTDAHPAEEVLRITRKGAHVERANVQQVLGPRRTKRQSLGQLRGIALDENRRLAAPDEIDCEQRPGEAGADDDHRQGVDGIGFGGGRHWPRSFGVAGQTSLAERPCRVNRPHRPYEHRSVRAQSMAHQELQIDRRQTFNCFEFSGFSGQCGHCSAPMI